MNHLFLRVRHNKFSISRTIKGKEGWYIVEKTQPRDVYDMGLEVEPEIETCLHQIEPHKTNNDPDFLTWNRNDIEGVVVDAIINIRNREMPVEGEDIEDD